MKQTRQDTLPAWATFGLALVVVAAATLLRLAMDPWVGKGGIPYLTLNGAVALTAFLWGRNPGVVATFASALAGSAFVIPPRNFTALTSSTELLPLAIFIATGMVVSFLAGRLHASRELAEERAVSLNQRAAELQRERTLLEVMTTATDVMLVYLDRDFNFLSVNEAYARTCKMPAEQLIGKNHFALYPHAENEAIFRKVRDTGIGVFYKDKPFEFPDQPERGVTYWDWSLAPAKDASDHVTGLVFSLRETTEYKLVQKGLQESEERLQLFVEHAPAAVAVFDRQMRYLAASRRWKSDYGLGDQNIVGRRHYEVFPEISQRWKDIHQRCLAGAVEMCEEDPFPRGDGHVDWVRWEIHPWRASDGAIGGITIFSEVITERKRAEEALREGELRYRNLFESMDEGFALCELVCDDAGKAVDFRYLNINPAFEKLTGLSAGKVLGKRATEAIPGIEHYWIDQYAQVVKTGQSLRFSSEAAALGRHFEVYAYTPAPNRFAAIFTDVTERKRAEEQLRLHITVLESAANAIVITGADGIIQWVNPAFTRLTGYTPAEAVGQNPRVLNSGAHDAAFFGRMWETIGTGNVWHGEVVNRRKDGVLYSEEMTITPVRGAAGQITHFIAIKQDISERKRAEEALRDAAQRLKSHLENSPVAVIEFDTEMRITRWTEAAERIFGWSVHEVLGKQMWEVPWICEEDRAKVVKVSARLLDGQDSRNVSPNRNLRKDGSVIWCEWYNSSLHDEQGRLDSIFSLVLDVTERVKAQEAVQHARNAAEAASKAKDHFLAVLSHELRNPLNPVLAAASLLREDPRFDAETHEQLAIICRNAELEARLIDDLLDVTRIERGKVELDRRPVNLGTIIQRAVEVCMPNIKARGLEFGVDAPDGPYWIDGDAARLQQVFWNLLRNAIKFTPMGGCVGVRCRRDGQGFVVAQVNDSGEGIEPQALGRIFNAFEQAERSITRQFGGLGLGLTICKALVDLHGGTIAGSSEGRGKGASFTVRLPLLPDEVAALAGDAERSSASGAGAARSLRILLVEDHGDTARVMQRLLTVEGHTVGTAADVTTALRLAQDQTFDLVLSDLGLPDGTGLDLMRQLRQMGLDMPGIALSGYGQEKDMQASRDAGFDSHLVKPVNLMRLKEVIARVVGNRTSKGRD